MSRAQSFTNLHIHSHYSLLQALPHISDLVSAAKNDGQQALALTDAGNLYGAIDFYKECKKQDVKPILGIDCYVAPRTRHDKEHRVDNHTSRLVLLAANDTGYRNLLKLITRSYMEGFYYNPRVDRELLEEHGEGLIAIVPSLAGEIPKALKESDDVKARESIHWHKTVFKDNCFIEITTHQDVDGHDIRQKELVAFAKENNVPIVAGHDTYYLKPEDALARELVMKIRTGEKLDREQGVASSDFAFMSQQEALKRFSHLPEAIINTEEIANRCDLTLDLGTWMFPDFPIPHGSSHNKELRALANRGLEMREIEKTPEVLERINYELSIIENKGYSPYFLAVSDLLRFARENKILTNTRGSAAGSFVSYLCGITTVNPLTYRLPFERFLNPDRPSAPDIDMDIADNRRDEVIDYARKKYGADHVAQIGTFGTMMARAAVRDVSRALGHSYGTGDQIAKMIPFGKQGFPVTIESALAEVPELKDVWANDADAREILDLAQKIEGNARHVGVHAAGVVISPTPAVDFVPLQMDPKGGKIITQYDMHAVEDAGLLKFDFLGLKNLSILADSVQRVKTRFHKEVDVVNLPLDDTKTYEMLSRGETLGVFQMGGSGMTAYLKELRPARIEDLSAMVALYRPGPMAFIPDYIERKGNPSLVKYLDPRLEPILKPTYGILVYQDDLLLITVQLAGYSWGGADKFRKAVGKKIPEEMAKQKEPFVKGCIEHGMNPTTVQKLWDQIETFAAYGFNKAHASSYGMLAYQTAYMKANYPVDYMASLLTADAGDVDKIAAIVAECKRMGISVLPPDVNLSFTDFTVTDEQTIRFGLSSVKNFGEGIAHSIIEERERGGVFKDLPDFLARIRDRNLNKKSLESLIQCGALDAMGERGRLISNLDLLLSYHKEHIQAPDNQNSLFGESGRAGSATLTLPDAPPAPPAQYLMWEKELLGLYISGHPLDQHREKLARQKLDITAVKSRLPEGVTTVIAGLLENMQPILTKKGDRMAFARLSDLTDSIEIVCFPRVLKEYDSLLQAEACIMAKGRMSLRNGEKSFVVEAVKAL